MSSMPAAPYKTEPYRIAEETYVLPHVLPLGEIGNTYLNAMVIRGKEPIVVDTSGRAFRDGYMEQLWGLVDPKNVRWIFISHDDTDHVGNLPEVMQMAPNATLIGTMFMLERVGIDIGAEYRIPLERVRLLNDGEKLNIADRTLVAVRPPTFDSPVTRGMFDTKTGVYWAGDAFGVITSTPVDNSAEVPLDTYREGIYSIASLISPWHAMLDRARYSRHIDRVASLPINVVASGHGPATYRELIPTAVEVLRGLPERDVFPDLTQRDLDALLAGATLAVA